MFVLDIVPNVVCVIAKQKPTMQKKLVTSEKNKLIMPVYNCSKHPSLASYVASYSYHIDIVICCQVCLVLHESSSLSV